MAVPSGSGGRDPRIIGRPSRTRPTTIRPGSRPPRPMLPGSVAGAGARLSGGADDFRARRNVAGQLSTDYNGAGGNFFNDYRAGLVDRTDLDNLLGGVPPVSPGPGPGGGGGGGGAAGPSAEEVAAYTALYNSMAPNTSQFDVYDESMRKAYDPAPIQAASKAGVDRLAPIQQELASRAAQARTDVSGAYGAGDARLKALQNEYLAQSQAAAGGLNNILGAFDAGSIAPSGAQNLQNLFANSRVANEGYRTVSDAGLADRPAVYAGLNADVLQGINRDQVGLESRNALALQQALAQSGVERMKYTTQQEQDRLKLKAELAAMGIIV